MFQFLCGVPRGDLPIGPFEPKAAKQIAEIEAELEAAEVGGLGLPGQLRLPYIAGGWS